MRPPLAEFFAPPRRNRRLWIAAALSVAFLAAQLPAAQTMSDRGAGIIPFEVARTEDQRRGDPRATGATRAADAASASLVLDFGYLVGYGLLLAGLNGMWSAARRGRGAPAAGLRGGARGVGRPAGGGVRRAGERLTCSWWRPTTRASRSRRSPSRSRPRSSRW